MKKSNLIDNGVLTHRNSTGYEVRRSERLHINFDHLVVDKLNPKDLGAR